jgi:exopolysaccharide biosynthesis polyprenyl glycosylphosphotransferase
MAVVARTPPLLRRKERLFGRLMLGCDVLALAASYLAAYVVRERWLAGLYGGIAPLGEYEWILWAILPLWMFALAAFGLYHSPPYRSLLGMAAPLAKAHVLASLALMSLMFLSRGWDVSRLFIQAFVVISAAALALEKTCIKCGLDYRAQRLRRRERWRVLLVGESSDVERYRSLLREHPHWSVHVIGVLPPRPAELIAPVARGAAAVAAVAMPCDWREVLGDRVVDEVVAACPWRSVGDLEGLMAACRERGIVFRLLLAMPPTDIGAYHVDDLGAGACLLSLETVPQEYLPLMAKRAIDIASSVVGLLICALLYPFHALWLWHVSPGAAIFRQQRPGQNGRLFTLYKFRTMHPDAEPRRQELLTRNEMRGSIFKIKDDPRIVRGGTFMRRTHLDELPQFWNVLRGEMSLVGPRPCPSVEVAQYEYRQRRRLSMKPGITGLWQVSGNGRIRDFEEVVRLDCAYIDNWSLWLDFKIVARTVAKVIRGDGW